MWNAGRPSARVTNPLSPPDSKPVPKHTIHTHKHNTHTNIPAQKKKQNPTRFFFGHYAAPPPRSLPPPTSHWRPPRGNVACARRALFAGDHGMPGSPSLCVQDFRNRLSPQQSDCSGDLRKSHKLRAQKKQTVGGDAGGRCRRRVDIPPLVDGRF